MRATVLVLVENVNAYLPHLEDLGFRLILRPPRRPGPRRSGTTPRRSMRC